MPIPKPKNGEKQDDFIERCMSNETMKDEYDDNDQRLAICFSQWKNKGKKSMESKIERRSFQISELRIQEGVDGGSDKLIGHAAVFNSLSENLGGFREKISPGAFKKSAKSDDIRALVNHDSNHVLGRTSAGTLSLKEDQQGLRTEIIPPDTQWARDLKVSIKRGDITQMSFGFDTIADSWERGKDEDIRTLDEVKLFDVSVVTFPAYLDTDIQVALRSHEEWQQEQEPDPSLETEEEEPEDEQNETVPISILRKRKELKDKVLNI